MKIDSFSIEGIHYSNEDSLSVHQMADDKVVAVLADGMGGLTFGKMAADLIVGTITTYVREHMDELSVKELLCKALQHADEAISRKSLTFHSKMGAAVAVAFIDGRNIHYTWQGNVRIYLSDCEETRQLTTDHTLDAGHGKHLLTRCIKGAGIRPDVPYQHLQAKAEDTLLLCSDGLYNQININQIFDKTLPTDEGYDDDASLIWIVL